jgi:hypothetical protein
MTTPQSLTTKAQYAELVDKFETFLFDCDGVIWQGPKAVRGVKDVLEWLRSKGSLTQVNLSLCARILRGTDARSYRLI